MQASRRERESAEIRAYSESDAPCTAPNNAAPHENPYYYANYFGMGLHRVPRKKVRNHPRLHLNLGKNRITVLKQGMLSNLSPFALV